MTSLRATLAGLLLLLFNATGAAAEPALNRLNLTLVDGYVIPAYAAFAAANAGLQTRTQALCATPSQAGLAAARTAYHEAMDAFMAVQFIRFGPGEIENRPYRVQLYPERKNAIARHMAQLLARPDAAAFQPAAFARASAAVQGLPALEQLLFEDDHVAALLAGEAAPCALAMAIAANLEAIAMATLSEWQAGPEAYRDRMAGAGSNRRYRSDTEATLDLFKTLHGGLQLVADLKLKRALGDKAEELKARQAESWRSHRSLRNVKLNLQALQHFYGRSKSDGFRHHVATVGGDPVLAEDIAARFDDIVLLAARLPDEFTTAVTDPAGYAALAGLAHKIDILREIVAKTLSTALGIPVGFNALDGD